MRKIGSASVQSRTDANHPIPSKPPLCRGAGAPWPPGMNRETRGLRCATRGAARPLARRMVRGSNQVGSHPRKPGRSDESWDVFSTPIPNEQSERGRGGRWINQKRSVANRIASLVRWRLRCDVVLGPVVSDRRRRDDRTIEMGRSVSGIASLQPRLPHATIRHESEGIVTGRNTT